MQHRIERRKQQPTNIAALVATNSQDNEIEQLKKQLKNTKKANLALRQNVKSPYNPTKASTSRIYSWDVQLVGKKDFQTREEFLTRL